MRPAGRGAAGKLFRSPDHVPLMAGDRRVGQAFTLGYVKAMLQRADEEAGVPAGDAPAAAPRA
jgi:hypothetical protein